MTSQDAFRDALNEGLRRNAERTAKVKLEIEITHRLWVCTDCILVLANGETGEIPDGQPEPWALWPNESRLITPGGEHHEECPNGPDSTTRGEQDCDCGVLTFSTSSCDGCGSHLAGERYSATVFNR